MVDATRFPVRFTGAVWIWKLLGLTPNNCYVEVTGSELDVRMAWGFKANVPRSTVRSIIEDDDRVWGWGAHGWRGVWLVNGSSKGIVRVEFDPPGWATVLGVTVRLRVLRVSVVDAAALIRALHAG